MKRLIVSGSICVLSLLASCSPGDGTIESCTSAYVGSYEGTSAGESISGPMIGQFDALNGRLEVVMKVDTATVQRDFNGGALVDGDGNMTPESPASVRIIQDGNFDFNDCEASGNWVLGADASGTWRIALPDSAF